MKTYTADQLVKIGSEQIDILQQNNDEGALEYIADQNDNLSFLTSDEKEHLKEYYTDTMEKYRLLYEAFVEGLRTEQKDGFPEHIYNINLKDGNIETDKNNRRINYTTEILAPFTSSVLHYINNECNDMYIIFPPIKDIERTIQKIIEERTLEHKKLVNDNLDKFTEEEPELPFANMAEPHCPTIYNLQQQLISKKTKDSLTNIAKDDIIPKDIYRLSITSRYKQDLITLIEQFQKKFPSYIQFENDERNSYNLTLKENPRRYLDIKKIARITIPGTNRYFYVEFQFKQTNMFFAHIRSHSVYEQFRVLDAKYKAALETAQKKKNTPIYEEAKNRAVALKKQCEEKRALCVSIHKSAIHQSNMYLLNKLMWFEKNADGLHGLHGRFKKNEKDQYLESIRLLKNNYIVESYEPFDGAMDFATTPSEYLNKAYYLKMIGVLPENFDELGKNAPSHISKAWENLSSSDLRNFDRLTAVAIKYQDVIHSLQKEMQTRENQISMPIKKASNER